MGELLFWLGLYIKCLTVFLFLHHSGEKSHVSKLFWMFKQRRQQTVQVMTPIFYICLLAVGIQ